MQKCVTYIWGWSYNQSSNYAAIYIRESLIAVIAYDEPAHSRRFTRENDSFANLKHGKDAPGLRAAKPDVDLTHSRGPARNPVVAGCRDGNGRCQFVRIERILPDTCRAAALCLERREVPDAPQQSAKVYFGREAMPSRGTIAGRMELLRPSLEHRGRRVSCDRRTVAGVVAIAPHHDVLLEHRHRHAAAQEAGQILADAARTAADVDNACDTRGNGIVEAGEAKPTLDIANVIERDWRRIVCPHDMNLG